MLHLARLWPALGSAAPAWNTSSTIHREFQNFVDEINLFTFPVVVGQGTRLFPDTGRDRALELVESRATPSGVTIQVYRTAGRPRYATATAT